MLRHLPARATVCRSRRATATLISLLLALAAAAPATASPLSAADRSFVDTTVANAIEQHRLPGVSIRISGPRGSYTRTYGVADTASGAPIALDDHVRIASITKTFVATAVLRQVERGRLQLSDTLSKWVPRIPNGQRITVRQLLAMRSGIYDFTSDPGFNRRFDANPRMAWSPSDALAIIRRHRPAFAPGAKTEYADSNYVLLGLILERVTGRSVESVIATDVIRPAGLQETTFPTTAAMPAPFAHGYYAGADGEGALRDYTWVNPAVAWTAGAMVSTLPDLARWGRVLARGTLLSERMQRARLRLGLIPNDGPPVGYGLGILGFGDWLGHDGAIFGFSTATFYEPSSGAQITAAANLSSNFSTPTLEIFGQIAAHLYPSSLR